MPLKNGNTVAVERRVDLASFFCMIARHGPAVALVVIAMVSVLAGFILYRTMRGKRRKAAAADGACESSGAETAAPVIQQSLEESVESTDGNDEVSSDVMEDDDMIQSDLNIRHRRTAAAAAAETKPPTYAPPISDIQAAEIEHTTADDTEETVVLHSYKASEMSAEETDRDLMKDAHPVAEMTVEDDVDCHQRVTDDIADDFTEEVHDDDSCFEEPDLTADAKVKEVFEAAFPEGEDVAIDKNVSDNDLRQEEKFQCALDSPLSFEQNLCKDETADDERILDSNTTLKTNNKLNLEDSVSNVESTPTNSVCYCKDEGLENQNSSDYQSYTDADQLLDAEEDEDEKAEEKAVDYHITTEPAETRSTPSDQDTHLLSTQQDQFDCLTDKEMLHPKNNDMDEGNGLAGKATNEVLDEDCLSKTTATTETKEETVPVSHLYTTENVTTSAVILDISGPPAIYQDQQTDHMENGKTFAERGFDSAPGILEKEDEVASFLNTDTDLSNPGSLTPSHETKTLPENVSDETIAFPDKCIGQGYVPEVQPNYINQQTVPLVNNEDFDQASVVPDLDTDEKVTSSPAIEELSSAQLLSICQDQPSGPLNNEESTGTTKTDSVTNTVVSDDAAPTTVSVLEKASLPQILHPSQDQENDNMNNNEPLEETSPKSVVVHDNENITAPPVSEEISHPDMLSFSQDHSDDSMKNADHLSEDAAYADPDMCEKIRWSVHQMNLPPFEQSEQKDVDVSSPGVGKESGISSMAVSPDLQDAGNELDLPVGIMVPQDCDLQSKAQSEAQFGLPSVSVMNEAGAFMVPTPDSVNALSSQDRDLAMCESFVTNEDIFGQEIETGYLKAMDNFAVQVTADVTQDNDNLKIEKGIAAAPEVEGSKERESAKKKVEAKVEKEKEEEEEEEYEKTEISIMEATMDNNEWITESNYQVLPWLNFTAPSFVPEPTKNNQISAEECQYSTAATDATHEGATATAQIKQPSPLPLVEENMENNKKVVAVQPMPQNVNVTFRVHYFTQSPFQTVAVTGDQQELGNWKGFIPLERAKDGHWVTVVSLPAESHVQWKFVLLEQGEVCRWEECGNRLLDTGYGDDLLVHKWWGLM